MIVEGLDKLLSLDCSKRHGYSSLYGTAFYGYARFGEFHLEAGIYSHKVTKKGKAVSKMRFYWPSNPRTVAQQARRTLFANGKAHWDSLTLEQKERYNTRARSLQMTGYNYHQRLFLNGRTL